MNQITRMHLRWSCRPSRNKGLTTIELILLVLIAASFIFAIGYFVNKEGMTKMFENVREVIGFSAKKN